PESKPRDALQIVGIAPPIREELLDREPVSHVYVPFGRNYGDGMHLHVKRPSLDESAGLDLLRGEIRAVDSRLPMLALSTMRAFHEKSLELFMLKTGARLFTSLGALALLL